MQQQTKIFGGQRLVSVVMVAGIVILVAALFRMPFASALYRTSLADVSGDVQTWYSSWRSQGLIRDYLQSHPVRKLQIGAGSNNLQGWLNTDIEPEQGQAYLDATKPFPLPDQSIHFIFSEHVIEHLSYSDGLAMLKECHRVLAPGGKVRIATPNLQRFVNLFRQDKSDDLRRYMEGKLRWHAWPKNPSTECFILNLELREFGHRFVYDVETLRGSLTSAGLQPAGEFTPGQSDVAELKGVEGRQNSGVRDLNAYESMILQATRP
jgi:predicted SAM-dependent methyltransferase